jgi:hypothetical protein
VGLIDDGPGRAGPRSLRRLADRLFRVVVDAQARDWTAERPDPVGFALLGRATVEVRRAAGRYGRASPLRGGRAVLLAAVTWIAVTASILLLVDDPAAPLPLAAAIVCGMLGGQVVISADAGLSRARALREAAGPAPIDDPAVRGELIRRIEAAAAAARADPDERHRLAAEDLERAAGWVAAGFAGGGP